MQPVLIIIAAVVLLPLIFVIGMYNGLVRIRNHCREAWSNIDTELKRRYDLIPNLVRTVQGYAEHERELLEEITRLRDTCAGNNGTPAQQAESENQLIGGLNRLLARVENYPDLKASENFLDLQQELTNTEDRIQAARRFYNGNVRENNNKVESFPSNIIAGMFNFKMWEYFKIDGVRIREAPQAEF